MVDLKAVGAEDLLHACVIMKCSSECMLTSPSLFPLALPKLCFLSLKRNLKKMLLCSFVVVSIGIH